MNNKKKNQKFKATNKGKLWFIIIVVAFIIFLLYGYVNNNSEIDTNHWNEYFKINCLKDVDNISPLKIEL